MFNTGQGDGDLEQRAMEDVVAKMRSARERGKKTTLFLGAGCSVTADIPLAQGIVQQIQERFGAAYKRAKRACTVPDRLYQACLAELDPGQRHDLLQGCVQNAQMNAAHIAVACLIQQDWVGRVLTVNFDNLVLRACALLHEFPAVFDLAVPPCPGSEPPAHLAGFEGKAILHLHGRHTNLTVLHTEQECERQARQAAPVFETAYQGPMIVCGYSGANDPLFRHHLAQKSSFYHSLYWVARTEETLEPIVTYSLSKPDQYAYLLNGYTADDFFRELARTLGCFPPALVTNSFLHSVDPLDSGQPQSFSALRAEREEDMSRLREEATGEEKQKISEDPAAGHARQGYLLSEKREASCPERIETMWQAVAQYEAALTLKPDYLAVLNNLGLVFADMANDLKGEERHTAQREAIAKYEAALKLKPDYPRALYNLGRVLVDTANDLHGERRHAALCGAIAKYEAALKLKPDYREALNNLGIARARLGIGLSGEDRDQAFLSARTTLMKAAALEHTNAFYNLACLEALIGDEQKCREWILKSYATGALPARVQIETETDFDSMRDREWFQELLAA